ncbi:hypothetical protein C9I98_07890 [Photobacterium sanctipauli]|uniref:Uncharacterized protein n=1 Tax=Photobacterium sanctipauli TaxID=1342794 RepID=A0A2T3NWT3_9GAMM|nr:hypothetical protein [Photobacterium sanctipauli]PSW20753.1 hypothetical protein C9I98_07890 [Photobacterium sanctipauli]
MSKIQYNCTCCGKPVNEKEALEAEKIMLETKLLRPKLILDIIKTLLNAALIVIIFTYLPDILKAINTLNI